MSTKNLKFLSKEVADLAIQVALNAVAGPELKQYSDAESDLSCHVLVMVPCLESEPNLDGGSMYYSTERTYLPKILATFDGGRRQDWRYPFDLIARNKAYQLWYGMNDGRTGIIPHLIFSGDTKYWGAVKREGLVAASSGFSPQIDRLVCSIVLDTCIAIAYDNYEKSLETQSPDRHFYLPQGSWHRP